MMGKKAFPANLKHENYVSQWGEHGYSAHNKKNGDYFEHPSLSYFMNELWL